VFLRGTKTWGVKLINQLKKKTPGKGTREEKRKD
jgi:hypothetical protein